MDRGEVRARLRLFVLVALAHVGGAVLAKEVNHVTSKGVSLFPAAGVTVAALLLVPRSRWLVVLASAFVSELATNLWLVHEVAGTAIGSALSNAVEPWLGAWVVMRRLGRPPRLQRSHELWEFIFGAVLVGPLLGTLVGVTSTRFTPGHDAFFEVAGRWYVGDGLGVLIVGALIVAWGTAEDRLHLTFGLGAEAFFLTGTLLVVTAGAFWGTLPALAYASLPVLGWAALRFGVRGATASGVVVATLADWATLTHHGLFASLAHGHQDQALWQLQLFLGIVVLTGLVLASQVYQLDVTVAALRDAESTQRFRALLESSPDPVLILRLDGTIDYANVAYQELVNQSAEQLSRAVSMSDISPSQRGAVREAFEKATQAEDGERIVLEVTLGPLDRIFEAAVTPMRQEGQRVLLATLRDVTARREAEAVTQRALAQAENATRAKSDFLAMMSHEIRTPMNGVIGMVDILGRMSLQAEQRQIVGTISESAQALLAVLNDILDFSKIEAGKLTIEAAPFDLREVVDGVTEMLASGAAAKSIELSCCVEEEVPDTVIGDAVRVRQVIFNLLGNAVKFTETGGVTLHVALDARRVRFVVRDTGIGMSAEQQAGLFEAFVQAEQSTTRRFGGSGLGLAIVARLVELMHGEVEVRSEPDEGSTFSVALPLLAQEGVSSERHLAGVDVLVVTAGAGSASEAIAVPALRRAGAEVRTTPPTALDVPSGDVVLVCRDVSDHAPRGDLDQLAREQVVVCERAVDGTSWLPHAAAVATSAVMGRSLVRAVALAAGRLDQDDLQLAKRPATAGPSPDAPCILVAEDHPTNRIVIRRQLNLLGLACELAEDGAEALDLLAERDFALLLADCHMPRLDGFELTREIRRQENGSGRHLPIVALTASALPSEAERCIEAGMDLVLTKPVALDALGRALSTWVQAAPAPAPNPGGVLMDLTRLTDLVGDDADAVRDVVSNFVESADESRRRLDQAVAVDSDDGVRSAAHRLLAGARTLGAQRLAAVCEQIESGQGSVDPALVASLRGELAELVAALTVTTEPGGARD